MIRKSPNQNPQNLTLNIVLTLIVTLLALLARKALALGPEHPSRLGLGLEGVVYERIPVPDSND